jgi:hypothetical protein
MAAASSQTSQTSWQDFDSIPRQPRHVVPAMLSTTIWSIRMLGRGHHVEAR